jgi:hypothetical protein
MWPRRLPKTVSVALPIVLLLGLALGGCVTDTGPEAAAPATTSSVPAPGHNAHASAKKDDWWKEGGVTREKISAMCWMKYEQGRKDLPIDKRADLVNQCVADAEAQYQVH